MRTISDIGFFNMTGEGIPTASKLTVQEYAESKHVGRYKTIELSGVQVVQKINEIIKKHVPSHSGDAGTIFVYRDHYSTPGMLKSDIKPDTPISALSFDRIIGVIDILDMPEYSARIAIKYETDAFVEVAFGTNVKVCSNYTIFGRESMWRMSRKEKVDLETLLNMVDDFMGGIQEKMKVDLDIINRLSQVHLSSVEEQRLIGELIIRSRRADALIQLTDITAAVDEINTQNPSSAWDYLNCFTRVIRFDTSSGAQTLQHLENICGYFTEVYLKDEEEQAATEAEQMQTGFEDNSAANSFNPEDNNVNP